MGQDDESMDRLERALDRIEAGIERPDPVAAEVAARLDGVIARVRAGLADGPDGLTQTSAVRED